jgi:hypothetical protein
MFSATLFDEGEDVAVSEVYSQLFPTSLHSLRNRNAQQLHACFNYMRR